MWTQAVTILCIATIFSTVSAELEVVNQWGFLDFDFPDYEYVNNFKPENTVFTGMEIADDRIFLAIPRLRAGIPATLNYISRNSPAGSSPTLHAYPDWSFHTAGLGGNITDCSGLTSVYRIRQDSCNRLWVLDSGVQTSIDDFQRVCNPKLVVFDLHTNQVVRTVMFPKEVQRPATLMTNLVIDETVQGKCDSAMIYMSDTAAPGIIVYDAAKDSIWRFIHPAMYPDPDFSDYQLDGEMFTLMDGIVGLGFSANLRNLFFQPLATDRIYSVSTDVLTKGPLAEGEVLPVSLLGKKSSQGLGLAVDPVDDSVIFSPITETSLASWSPKTNQQKLIAFDRKRLQFLAEIRVAEKDNNNIWFLSTRFQKFFRRTVSPNEINLRIMRVNKNKFPSFQLNNNLYY